MARSEMGSGRTDVRCGPGGSGMVLLQRGDRQGNIRDNDKAGDEGGSDAALPVGPEERKASGVVEITDLTPGERLLIHRRRSGESQEAAARRLLMTRNTYGRLERDEETNGVRIPEISELTIDEKCLLVRRRAGRTQEDCADDIGVTRFWFNQMETGKVPCDDLADFWGIS